MRLDALDALAGTGQSGPPSFLYKTEQDPQPRTRLWAGPPQTPPPLFQTTAQRLIRLMSAATLYWDLAHRYPNAVHGPA